MVVLRLARAGAKKRPFYHVVAADKRMPRDGRFIERLGAFNPVARKQEVRLNLNKDRIDFWLSQGAQPSERVESLIKEFTKNNCEPVPSRPIVVPKPKPKKVEQVADTPEDTNVEAAADDQAITDTPASDNADQKAEAAAEAPAADDKPAEDTTKAEDAPADDAKADTEAPAEEKKAEDSADADNPAEETKAEEQPAEEAKADTTEEAPTDAKADDAADSDAETK